MSIVDVRIGGICIMFKTLMTTTITTTRPKSHLAFFVGLLLVGVFGFFSHIVGANPAVSKYRVVFHINSASAKVQAGALRNIHNTLKALGDKRVDLRVLLHSGGVSMVLRPEAVQRTKFSHGYASGQRIKTLRALRKRGVRFLVCRNTLRSKGASRVRDLFEVEAKDIVPSGVVALIKLQHAGFAYVKP